VATEGLGLSERRALLKRVGIFSQLEDRELDGLVRLTHTRRLGPREILFRAGSTECTELYAVMRGRIKITTASDDGKEFVLQIMGPGEVLGEIALLNDYPRTATVTAIDRSQLLVLQRRELLPFLEEQPKVAIKLLAVLGDRLRRASAQLEDAVFLDVRARLAKKLLFFMNADGEDVPEGRRFPLKLSQRELGELVGATRESVNKQLKTWERSDVIRIEGKEVTVLAPDELQSLAGLRDY